MNKLLTVILLCSLFSLVPLVFAAPPVTTVQQFSNGYVIKVPSMEYLKVNQSYIFDFQVYNISNGLPRYSGIGCYFHLYDDTGNHIYTAYNDTPKDQFDYEFKVAGGNFSKPSTMYYNIQCNGTALGGYANEYFYVTAKGYDKPDGIVIVFYNVGFILIMFFLSFLFIYSLGHFINFDFDLIDLCFNYGAFFALFAFYMLSQYYFSNPEIESILVWIINIGGFTTILVPSIALVISMIVTGLRNKKIEAVTPRFKSRWFR